MNRSRIFLGFLSLSVLMGGTAARAVAEDGVPYVGINLGASVPTNKNYLAHVNTGAAVNPYAGYMFNKYIGAQGEVLFTFQPPDNDHRGYIPSENQTSTLFGGTIGPRLSVPIGDYVDVYTTAQGGYFTGLSGRLNHSAPGFGVGGGVNYNPTPELSVGLFARWNRVYFSPQPTFLTYPGVRCAGSGGPPLRNDRHRSAVQLRAAATAATARTGCCTEASTTTAADEEEDRAAQRAL